MSSVMKKLESQSEKGMWDVWSLRLNLVVQITLCSIITLITCGHAHGANYNCSSGDVSCLMESINTANANSEGDTIELEAGIFTLTSVDGYNDGANGLPSITSNITIRGADVTIIERDEEADSDFRIFHVGVVGGLALEGLTISNGLSRDYGGGIYNSGTAILTDCTVSGNRDSGGAGCGIYNSGTITFTNCTVWGNLLSWKYGDGGGLYNSGTATLTNCTVFDNAAGGWGGNGGGIYNSGNVTLTNCTVSGNVGGGWMYGDGGGIWNSGTLELKNSIVANNTSGGDCFGEITSLAYNLDSDGTCNLTQPNDFPNTDPLLGEFTDDGASGRGHFPLLKGSPAIDKGDDTACPPTDQLGNPRVDGDGDSVIVCDIGAIEFQVLTEAKGDGGGGGGG